MNTPLYKVRKGNLEFFIQPWMVEDYAKLGYEVIRLDEVVVTDAKQEMVKIQALMKPIEIPITLHKEEQNEHS